MVLEGRFLGWAGAGRRVFEIRESERGRFNVIVDDDVLFGPGLDAFTDEE
jgi:hypothetical protein